MENQKLTGKNAVVLGGYGNIGEGIVRAFLAAGANVVVPGRNAERLERLTQSIDEAYRARLVTLVADTESFNAIREVVNQIRANVGPIHHAVFTVGGWWHGTEVANVDADAFNRYFSSPITAHFAFGGAVAAVIEQDGSYTIIQGNTVHDSQPKMSLIAMQGSAVDTFRTSLAADAGDRMRVNGIALKPVKTRAHPFNDENALSADDVGTACIS